MHTYYPVSSGRGRTGERVEARLPTYSHQWEANERLSLSILIDHPQLYIFGFKMSIPRRSPRIVNQASTTLRQCWPNPFGAEREGCSLQYYHSALYNICRCACLFVCLHLFGILFVLALCLCLTVCLCLLLCLLNSKSAILKFVEELVQRQTNYRQCNSRNIKQTGQHCNLQYC